MQERRRCETKQSDGSTEESTRAKKAAGLLGVNQKKQSNILYSANARVRGIGEIAASTTLRSKQNQTDVGGVNLEYM